MIATLDWSALFVPEKSLLELILRGSVMYLTLFALIRILIRRNEGHLSVSDMLLIVLIADAAQNGMAGQYKSITEGMVLCATIIGWSYLLDWLAYRIPALRGLLHPPALPLIKNGRLMHHNMHKELITEDELRSHLRQQGVESTNEVQIAFIEPDGQFCVIKRKKQSNDDHHSSSSKNELAGS
jgi:uncharacterized membrane protein YcaP (DUF421 family)